MYNLADITNNNELQTKIFSFISQYGNDALEDAMSFYADMQQIYLIKTKTSLSKIRICEINYIEIRGHHMTIHTSSDTYRKYGSLTQELKVLSAHGFVKCNQKCIVSLYKIKMISNNDIILADGTILHMSRKCAPGLLMSFNRQMYSKK